MTPQSRTKVRGHKRATGGKMLAYFGDFEFHDNPVVIGKDAVSKRVSSEEEAEAFMDEHHFSSWIIPRKYKGEYGSRVKILK